MHRIPRALDLSGAVGQFATQVRVGQFDLQFTFGPVNIVVESRVTLVRNGEVIAAWEEGRWPDAAFYDVMNSKVLRCEMPSDRTILIALENGIEMQLNADTDDYECMQISIAGDPTLWVI
jgi:hypothetical protein